MVASRVGHVLADPLLAAALQVYDRRHARELGRDDELEALELEALEFER
jgi:hypothetical protein